MSENRMTLEDAMDQIQLVTITQNRYKKLVEAEEELQRIQKILKNVSKEEKDRGTKSW